MWLVRSIARRHGRAAALAFGMLAVARAAGGPSRLEAQAAPPVGWSFYGAGVVSPSAFLEGTQAPTFGVAVAALRETGTAFDFGVEALYERLAPEHTEGVVFYCGRDAFACATDPQPCTLATPGCVREATRVDLHAHKLQLLAVTRLRASRGAVRPFAESAMGVYHTIVHARAVHERTGADPGIDVYDERPTGTGLVLALGGGLEVPLREGLALLLAGRVHAQVGENARSWTPTFGFGVRSE